MLSPEKITIAIVVIFVVALGFLLLELFGDGGGEQELDSTVREESEEEVLEPFADIIKDDSDMGSTKTKPVREKLAPTVKFEEGQNPGSVIGRVVNTEGRSILDAKVSLYLGGNILINHPGSRKKLGIDDKTDKSGLFKLFGLAPGKEYSIEVAHSSYATSYYSPLILQPGMQIEIADIIMSHGVGVHGNVTTESGAPITNAMVQLFDTNRTAFLTESEKTPVNEMKTNSDGEYSFANLSFTAFEIRVSADGYGTQKKTKNQIETQRRTRIDFELGPGMEIGGIVIDTDGVPVVDVTVSAYRRAKQSEYFSSGSAQSERGGTFTIEGLADGQYVVRVDSGGYSVAARQMVRAGTDDLEIKLQRRGGVAGVVRDQTTGNPVTRYEVEIFRLRGNKPRQKTSVVKQVESKTGSFQINNLDPGNFSIEVTAPGYAKCSSSLFHVERGEIKEGVEILMNEGGVLSGRVVGTAGKPVSNVSVELRFNDYVDIDIFRYFGSGDSGSRGDSGTVAVTDSKGYFTKRLITQGTYQVYFKHNSYTENTVNDIEIFEGKSAATDLGVVTLTRGAVLKGKTLDSNGFTMPGAMVTLNRKDGFHLQVMSDNKGYFKFPHLTPGEYTVMIQSNQIQQQSDGNINIFEQLFLQEQSKVTVVLHEGVEEEVVVRLSQGL